MPSVKIIKNQSPDKGLRESVRLGVEAAEGEAAYYMFFHCDEPFLDTDTVRRIVDEREPGFIVEPCYKNSSDCASGRPGNPCLFSGVFREELLSLREGETPRIIKNRHAKAVKTVEVFNSLTLRDIDNEEDLKSAREALQ